MTWIITIVVILVISEAISYLICRSNQDIKEILKKALKMERKGDVSTLMYRYAEHPFLNFYPRPYYKNSYNQKIHNKFGFRADDDFENIDNNLTVYCVGASATYCNFIEENEKTWPCILEKRLKSEIGNDRIKVINGGCGAWTTLQSLTRFASWVDMLKPKLVIVYDFKNDFSVFANTNLPPSDVMPDYVNVMKPLRFDKLTTFLPWIAQYSYVAKVLYGNHVNSKYLNVRFHTFTLKEIPTHEQVEERLNKVTDKELDLTISRFKSFISICAYRKINILFVGQKVIGGVFRSYVMRLNDKVKSLEDHDKGCYFYDFNRDGHDEKDLFFDNMHFTPRGAEVFAECVKEHITKNVSILKA